MNTRRLTPVLFLIGLLSTSISFASMDDRASPPHPAAAAGAMTTIPQAAFDACAGKTAGAEVTWKGMHGTMLQGTCRSFGGGTLVAFPKSASGMRPGGGAPVGAVKGGAASGAAMAPTPPSSGASGSMNPGGRIPAPAAAPGMGDSMLNRPLVPPK